MSAFQFYSERPVIPLTAPLLLLNKDAILLPEFWQRVRAAVA